MSGKGGGDREAPATVASGLQWAAARLREGGVDEPRLDAEVLLADLLGLARASLLARDDRRLSSLQVQTYRDRIDRRARGEPVAYLTGGREFFSLDFLVDRRVMIPRPETEFLVDEGVRFLRSERGGGGIAADIGTGSGAIAVSIAHTLAECRVIATDISPAALAVARENARHHGVADRIEFREGDLDLPLRPPMGGGRLDAILCNPPYVRRDDTTIDPAVARYEPGEAVFARGDPEAVYRRLARAAADLLSPGGLIACEVAAGSAPLVAEIFGSQETLSGVFRRVDLTGIERIVGALRTEKEGRADG